MDKDTYNFYYGDFDRSNPYELYVRNLISRDDLKNWLIEEKRKEIILKRKRVIESLCKEYKN